MLKKPLLIGLMLLPAIAIPVQADHGCDTTWKYYGPTTVVFDCSHGWVSPTVTVDDVLTEGLACFEVEQRSSIRIAVTILAACVDTDSAIVGASTTGTIYVNDGA